jgi:methylated-DNA-[protein]-cysteine S-methyltransferase
MEGRLLVSYSSDYGAGHLLMEGDYLIEHFLPGTLDTARLCVASNKVTSTARRLQKLLEKYFAGKPVEFAAKDLPIDWNVYSAFERRVAVSLLKTGYGKLTTYSGLAMTAGHPKAHRAVGNVMAKNPFPLLIPCHRVIRADGRMGGFSGGQGWKVRLLEIEGISASTSPNATISNRL